MKVIDNVAYGLRQRKVSKAEAYRRAEEALDLVQLEGWRSARPSSSPGDSSSEWPWREPS